MRIHHGAAGLAAGAQLEAMFPGRVDLGMGRATSGPVIDDIALQRDRETRIQADHQQQVLETLAWLYEAFPTEHAFAGNPLMPTVPEIPQTWLLGSSPVGSNLAAGLGIGYTFAGFINPAGAAGALRNYRQQFRPQKLGLDEPRAILAVNVTVGDTSADARHLVGSAKGFYSLLRRHGASVTIPSADEADGLLSAAERDRPTRITDGQWPQFVAGSPDEVRDTLDQMIEESRADEVMIGESHRRSG